MIRVESIVFNAFQVNTYLVWDESGECIVVDPAFYSTAEQQQIEGIVREKGLRISGQLSTHCHVDHVLGVVYMRSEHNSPFRAHREESLIADSAPLLGEMYGWKVEPLGGIDETLEDGQQVPVGKHFLQAILVPGHSPGSLAFYSPEGGFVITGDALFQGSIGRTDLPGGDYDTLIRAITERLLVLPPETVAYPGHGPSTTIGFEAAGNPYLKPVL
jgi:hydroxyacylglutathione hydrolase